MATGIRSGGTPLVTFINQNSSIRFYSSLSLSPRSFWGMASYSLIELSYVNRSHVFIYLGPISYTFWWQHEHSGQIKTWCGAPNAKTQTEWTRRCSIQIKFAIIKTAPTHKMLTAQGKVKQNSAVFVGVWHLSHSFQLTPSCSFARIQWRHWNNWVPSFAAHRGPSLSWHKGGCLWCSTKGRMVIEA